LSDDEAERALLRELNAATLGERQER